MNRARPQDPINVQNLKTNIRGVVFGGATAPTLSAPCVAATLGAPGYLVWHPRYQKLLCTPLTMIPVKRTIEFCKINVQPH